MLKLVKVTNMQCNRNKKQIKNLNFIRVHKTSIYVINLSEFLIMNYISCPYMFKKRKIPRKYILIMNLNIRIDFIPKIYAQCFHLLVSGRHGQRIHQTAFIILCNIFICVRKVPSSPLFCRNLR